MDAQPAVRTLILPKTHILTEISVVKISVAGISSADISVADISVAGISAVGISAADISAAGISAAEDNGGEILPKDIAFRRIPDPNQLSGIVIFVDEAHQNITLSVTIHIIKGDGIECLLRVGDVHGKGHTVKEDLLRQIPVEGGAAFAHRDQHIHALAGMSDGAAANHHTGRAPIISRDIVRISAGGKAQAERHGQHKDKNMFPSIVHDSPPFNHSNR